MIIQGDSLNIPLADESIDSVVTDPPYGISFMGRKWDYDVPSVDIWKEVLRVMKPGAHALVACGTRTQHRMAVNLEDAGFEIRDCIVYAYGSGFPKSMDLGKAYDKFCGNEREVVGEKPTLHHGTKDNVQKYGFAIEGNINITKGTSEYEGWGTALKPAVELWTLCRKPLSEKTIIENVIKHGTGGINIDQCRIGTDTIKSNNDMCLNMQKKLKDYGERKYKKGLPGEKGIETFHTGRFPANLIHDGSDEVVSLFPVTSKSVSSKRGVNRNGTVYGAYGECDTVRGHDDNGGSASRFFYCAKASSSERNVGLDGLDKKDIGFSNGARSHPEGYDKAQTIGLNRIRKVKNHHPTVKPVKLMRYLCRLITPKNGIVLDPFCGSGSTGVAAKEEDFKFIGIERDREYSTIAYHRFNHQPNNYQIPII